MVVLEIVGMLTFFGLMVYPIVKGILDTPVDVDLVRPRDE